MVIHNGSRHCQVVLRAESSPDKDVDNFRDSQETAPEKYLIFSISHKRLQEILWSNIFDRMLCNNCESFHKGAVLIGCDRERFLCCARPAESACLQALVKEQKSVSFIYQPFDPV